MPHRMLVSLFALFLLAGCGGDSDPTDPEGTAPEPWDLFLDVSLADVSSLPQEMTGADAVLTPISGGKQEITATLDIEDSRATGLVGGLEPGAYSVEINVRHGVPVLVRGTANHTVVEGVQDTLVVSQLDLDTRFPDLPRRILFVGNSLTSYNGGLGNNMNQFVEATGPGLSVFTFQLAPGGCTLERHWTDDDLDTRDLVSDGAYDAIVLQGSPSNMVNEPASFRTYAPLFIDLINGRGLQPALFIPPSYEDYPQHAETLVELCEDVTQNHPATLIPINQTWYHVLENRPSMPLFHTDGTHPSAVGTYLNMCVIYAALFQMSPVGCAFEYEVPLTEVEKNYLQEAAWSVTREYLGWDE